MPDTKISALPAAAAAAAANEFAINEAGTSKKVTAAQLKAFVDQALRNTNTGNVAGTFATDTYLADTAILIPSGRLQAKTIYRARFRVVKTAAGTAAPTINVRVGTTGTGAVGDASRALLTFVAQTAAADNGLFDVYAHFRSVGAGTSAVIEAVGSLSHSLDVTGLANVGSPTAQVVGGGFDSTTAVVIGLSVNGGASASWTVSGVQAELLNLT